MEVVRLRTVDAMVVFDLDHASNNAGGTRLAPDVTEREGALLARAMTYKFGVLGMRLGGAKGIVRATPDAREQTMARYCEAIRPLLDSGRFATGPDLGTYESDFAPLRSAGWADHVINSHVDGVAFEDVLTGFGVTVAADAALGGLDGRAVAIEGFGKVGAGVARDVVKRGGRVVAISTIAGSVADPHGLELGELWEARALYGDRLVEHLRRTCRPREALFEVDADALVPGARVGVLDESLAGRVVARVVVPAANVPYTVGGLAALRGRGIAAHADFVCNAAAVVGYSTPPGASQEQVLDRAGRKIADLIGATASDPDGPYVAACRIAAGYLRTWRDEDGLPAGPPLG